MSSNQKSGWVFGALVLGGLILWGMFMPRPGPIALEKKETKPIWNVSIRRQGFPLHLTLDSEYQVSAGFGGELGELDFSAEVPIFILSGKDGSSYKVASLDPQFNAEFKQKYLHRPWNSRDGFGLETRTSFSFEGLVVEVSGDVPGIVSGVLSMVGFQDNQITFAPQARDDWSFSQVTLDPRVRSSGRLMLGDPLLGKDVDDAYYRLRKNGDVKWSVLVEQMEEDAGELAMKKSGLDYVAYTGTTGQLAREYAEDKTAADQKYTWRKVRLEGVIGSLGVRPIGVFRDKPAILFWSDERDRHVLVECKFRANENEQISRLSEGGHIVIEGRCRGLFLDCISVAPCKIIQ